MLLLESEEMALGDLFDVDEAAHGEIDERRGDVVHVRAVVDERPELRRRRPVDRLVADDVRALLRIAAAPVPTR